MDFYQFGNCYLANRSVQDYCGEEETVICIVFLERFRLLPQLGFSLTSASDLLKNDLHPSNTVAYRPWDLQYMPNWTKSLVQKNSVLRIKFIFENAKLLVSFKMEGNLEAVSVSFNFPSRCPEAIYLAIELPHQASRECIAVKRIAHIGESKISPGLRKNDEDDQYLGPDLAIVTSAEEPPEISPPECVICCENTVNVVFLPCRHALCCEACKKKYILVESTKGRKKFVKTSDDIACPTCNEKITSFGLIWFSPRYNRCLMCGCDKWDTVAAGPDGCGCVLGCYAEATKWNKAKKSCPSCHRQIHHLMQIFLQAAD